MMYVWAGAHNKGKSMESTIRELGAPITTEEFRLLVTAILHSAIIDYIYGGVHTSNVSKEVRYQAAKRAKFFLLKDDYLMDWGDMTITPRQLLEAAELDIDYVRDRIHHKLQGVDPLLYPLKRKLGPLL